MSPTRRTQHMSGGFASRSHWPRGQWRCPLGELGWSRLSPGGSPFRSRCGSTPTNEAEGMPRPRLEAAARANPSRKPHEFTHTVPEGPPFEVKSGVRRIGLASAGLPRRRLHEGSLGSGVAPDHPKRQGCHAGVGERRHAQRGGDPVGPCAHRTDVCASAIAGIRPSASLASSWVRTGRGDRSGTRDRSLRLGGPPHAPSFRVARGTGTTRSLPPGPCLAVGESVHARLDSLLGRA